MRLARTLVVAVVAAVVAVTGGSSVAIAGSSGFSAEGSSGFSSYIVVFRDGVDVDAATNGLERAEGFRSDFRYHFALHGFAAHLSAAQLSHLQANPNVQFISPDGVVQAVDTLPLAVGDSAPTGVRRIESATTSTASRASTVAVAVIDTGVNLTHPDLSVVNGKNCVDTTKTANDDNGHGSHVSGTIAAKNTGAGVVGTAPGTTIVAVKVLSSSGSGTWAQVICGVDWVTGNAAAYGIKVASMSLGGSGSNDNNCGNTNGDALHKAICNSTAAGVTYVVAAGNSATNFSTFVPAAYPEALTVTAMSDSDGLPGALGGAPTCRTGELDDRYASFSNYAVNSTEVGHTVAGPGVCIFSTWMNGGYNTISGTSMATPHLSGIVALCLGNGGSAGPCDGMTSAQIVQKIRSDAASHATAANGFTGDPLHPITGKYFGYLAWAGAYNAVVPTDSVAPVVSAVAAMSITASAATIAWTTDEAATSQVFYGTTSAYGSATLLDRTLVTGHSVALTGLAASMTYHFRVESKDAASNFGSSTDLTFTTASSGGGGGDTTAPVISSVSMSGLGKFAATVNWTTDDLSDSQVEYGVTNTYGSLSSLVTTLVTSHSVRLSGLTSGTTYHFHVYSRNGSGLLTISGDYTFKTR